MKRIHLVIHGRVQGVGFRYFALDRARALGLGGAVWNRPDGTVEIEAEGDAAALADFTAAMRSGPSSARVTRVEESASEGPALHREFRITA